MYSELFDNLEVACSVLDLDEDILLSIYNILIIMKKDKNYHLDRISPFIHAVNHETMVIEIANDLDTYKKVNQSDSIRYFLKLGYSLQTIII